MKTARAILALVVVTAVAGTVLADWDEGDEYKMHFPQMPDPDGLDVGFNEPSVVADDWQCTESGLVKDIHFWFSSMHDEPFGIRDIHVSIYDNDPGNPNGYSHPGNLLWERDFTDTEDEFTFRYWGAGDQGWFDPYTSFMAPSDHEDIFQANITGIVDPFVQEEGEIYWLGLSVHPRTVFSPPYLGWKTTTDHFMDNGVWTDTNPGGFLGWLRVNDPWSTEPVDFAFVIVPEPASAFLLIAGGALLLRRRRRKD